MPRKLLNLAQDNRGKGAALRAESGTDGDGADVTTIYVYDVIDSYWVITASDFDRVLGGVTSPKILLWTNCPGGDVFEARAMMAAIAEHPAEIVARIDGLCASAATALTLACDSVEIVDGAFYMIHQAWTFAMGNADDMRSTADLLDKVDGALIAGYARKCGMSAEEIKVLMQAETWYDAQEAVDAGFCDALVEIPVGGSKANARAFNLAAYQHAPKALIEPADEPVIDETVRTRMMARLNLYERTA